MYTEHDTIAAQATAVGEGGIAIVRISGEKAEGIVNSIFEARNGRPLENRVLTYGKIVGEEGAIDEAMAVLIRKPGSYTREDVAEIQCHGSQMLVSRILSLVTAHGGRIASPGEFTYRAFMNGRIDLTQAEAVMKMIEADSDRAMKSAMRQLEGGVSSFVREVEDRIIAMRAGIAATIDFPDEVDEAQSAREIDGECARIMDRIRNACDVRMGKIDE